MSQKLMPEIAAPFDATAITGGLLTLMRVPLMLKRKLIKRNIRIEQFERSKQEI
jgi:hypothetical protein